MTSPSRLAILDFLKNGGCQIPFRQFVVNCEASIGYKGVSQDPRDGRVRGICVNAGDEQRTGKGKDLQSQQERRSH